MDNNTNIQKGYWKSKTFWVNLIAIVAFLIQLFWERDFIIPVEIQGTILAFINFVLRWITKEEIVWDRKSIIKK